MPETKPVADRVLALDSTWDGGAKWRDVKYIAFLRDFSAAEEEVPAGAPRSVICQSIISRFY
jgi:hypothetical protein